MPTARQQYAAHFQALQSQPIKVGFLHAHVRLKEACYQEDCPDTDVLNQTIGVQKSNSDKDRCILAWQGIFETIAYAHGIRDNRNEETQTHSAANGLASLIADNPHLVSALRLLERFPEPACERGPRNSGVPLRIKNTNYELKLMSPLAGRYDQLFGSCDSSPAVRQILVTEESPERFGLIILLHELIHAFQDCHGAGKNNLLAPAYFKAQAQGLVSFVQHNGNFFNWLTKRIGRPSSKPMSEVCRKYSGWR